MQKINISKLGDKAKQTLFDVFKPIKWKVVITAFLILLGFGIGVYFSLSVVTSDFLGEDTLLSFFKGQSSSLSSFFYRTLFSILTLVLLWICAKSKWLVPVALLLLFYKGYMLGAEVGSMLKFCGVLGIITSIIIIFPIQIGLLLCYDLFFWGQFCINSSVCLSVGGKRFFAIFLLIVLLLNIVLTILLWFFSPKIQWF